MKKIIYYVTNSEIEKAQSYFVNEFKNSSLFLKDKKFHFYSKINQTIEEIQVSFRCVEFNEELANSLVEILDISHNQAMKISDEPIEKFRSKSIYSEIYTTVNKYSYLDFEKTDNITIFRFIADLFYKYLMGHYLKNGNKRLSLMLLINLSWFFGYYLKFTKNPCNYDRYKSQLEEWVEKFQTTNNKENDIMSDKINEIEEWIKKHVVIALNWR